MIASFILLLSQREDCIFHIIVILIDDCILHTIVILIDDCILHTIAIPIHDCILHTIVLHPSYYCYPNRRWHPLWHPSSLPSYVIPIDTSSLGAIVIERDNCSLKHIFMPIGNWSQHGIGTIVIPKDNCSLGSVIPIDNSVFVLLLSE